MTASPDMMEVQEGPPSRPLTPNEQIDIMLAIETEDMDQTGTPSDRDLEVRPRERQRTKAIGKFGMKTTS